MKTRFLTIVAASSVLAFASCNSETKEGSAESTANYDTTAAVSTTTSDDAGLTAETASFTNVDPKTKGAIGEIVTHYLHVKNALSADNGEDAASGAKALVASLDKFDQSSLTDEQKKLYADVTPDLKEMAEHIAESAGKIDHQREHFVMMSADVHDLVKGFGTQTTLYVAHCPMANDNKGADWLSEKKEINNPYMGKKMPKCGEVQKVIK